MERTRKEYLVLRSDQEGGADIVGVFSSRKKARSAVEKDGENVKQKPSYWLVVLQEDAVVRGYKDSKNGII